MAFLSTSRAIFTGLESTPGTAVDLSAADMNNRIRELDFKVETQVDDENSKFLSGDLSGDDESIVGKSTGSASFKIKLTAGESGGTVGAYTHKLTFSDYLQNAGLVEKKIDCVAGTQYGTWLFYPSVANSSKTMTIAVVDKDSTKSTTIWNEIIGAISNVTIGADGVGAPWVASFEATGRVDEIRSVATSAVPVFDDANIMRIVADKFLNTTIKITDLETSASVEFCASKISLESGNEIAELECQATAAGILNNTITATNPKITIDPLLKTLEEFNYWTALKNEKFYKIEIDSADIHIYIPRAQLNSSSVADSNGFMRNEMTFRPLRNVDSDKPAVLTSTVGMSLPECKYFIYFDEASAAY